IDVNEYRCQPEQRHNFGRRHVGENGQDNLIAGFGVKRHQRDLQCVGTIAAGNDMVCARVIGKRGLEFPDLPPLDESGLIQHLPDCGINVVLDLQVLRVKIDHFDRLHGVKVGILQARGNGGSIKEGFYIVNHSVVIPDLVPVEACKFIVAYRENNGVVLLGRCLHEFQAVFMLHFLAIGKRIINLYGRPVTLEFPDDVDHAAVPDIRTVFLEGDAEHQDLRFVDRKFLSCHELNHAGGDVDAHVVVDSPTGQNYFRPVPKSFRLVCQVIGIHADTVSTYKSRFEGQEIPLCAGRLQHLRGVDTDAFKDHRQFVHKSDVDVAL